MVTLFLYKRYQAKQYVDDNYFIKKYLVQESVSKTGKPILWIYIPSIPNTRKMQTFGDGHSLGLNQEYLFLTLKSIIKCNNKSFTICILDNYSFHKIIPGWEYKINEVSPPISCNLIRLAMAKVLYYYGGIIVPISFLCFKDLGEMYDYGTKTNKLFICENINKSVTSSQHEYTTDATFMGCNPENQTIYEYVKYMEVVISSDSTAESKFSGATNDWFLEKDVTIISGKKIGVKTKTYKAITIEDLFSETYIPLSKDAYGVYIPCCDILNRVNYEWFSRLSKEEVLAGNTNIQKYILLASAGEPPIRKPNWVAFWKVPSDVIIYGLKPVGVGNPPRVFPR
jgi:hypothetical protein